ncbi:hypothetical protein AZE42_09335 [Rhizopogon vesiculosus]|uniref:Uncharacterized protein n=1 Tax=Rhizopogon vesiculosus TaxID=180088 RepID=A0A1J8PRS1_9AGAM|nr:hypothetical protein AZE42_09335 [Rhizopogon vesiculosus]
MLILKRETLECMRYDFVTSSTAEAVRHPHHRHPKFSLDRRHQQTNLPQISTCYPTKSTMAQVGPLASILLPRP